MGLTKSYFIFVIIMVVTVLVASTIISLIPHVTVFQILGISLIAHLFSVIGINSALFSIKYLYEQ
jgi:hypothetical protein